MSADSLLDVSYMDSHGSVSEGRIVTPKYYCGPFDQSVLMFDHGAQEPRCLKLDRILSAQPVAAQFDPDDEPSGLDDGLLLDDRLIQLGRVEIIPGDGQITLNWAFTASGAHMTVTKPTFAEAVAAAG